MGKRLGDGAREKHLPLHRQLRLPERGCGSRNEESLRCFWALANTEQDRPLLNFGEKFDFSRNIGNHAYAGMHDPEVAQQCSQRRLFGLSRLSRQTPSSLPVAADFAHTRHGIARAGPDPFTNPDPFILSDLLFDRL